MKKEWWVSGTLAAGCIALALFGQNGSGGADVMYGLTAPFLWLGAGLRALSLSGFMGNVLALLLYASLCLLPIWPLFKKCRRPKERFTCLLLVTMSAYLFFLLFFMVNPTMIQTLFHPHLAGAQDPMAAEVPILCMFFYSLLAAYWILGIMADTEHLAMQLRRLMVVLGAGMIVSVFYVNVANLKSMLALPNTVSNEAYPFGLGFPLMGVPKSHPACDGLIAVLRFVSDSAPTLLLFTVLPMAEKLLISLERNFFSEENQRYAAAIARRCKQVIILSLGGMLLKGVLQLLLAKWIANVNMTGEVPILVLMVSLAMMLLSRYLESSFKVYRENQMMI